MQTCKCLEAPDAPVSSYSREQYPIDVSLRSDTGKSECGWIRTAKGPWLRNQARAGQGCGPLRGFDSLGRQMRHRFSRGQWNRESLAGWPGIVQIKILLVGRPAHERRGHPAVFLSGG